MKERQLITPADFGNRISRARRDAGLNQTELAAKVGVGRNWISAVEQGKAKAELGLVLRTLRALGLELMPQPIGKPKGLSVRERALARRKVGEKHE